jgi:hypothetical protein
MSTFRKLASVMLPALFTAAACSDTGAGPDVQLLAQITSVEVVAPPVLEVGTHGQVRVVLRDRKGQPILGPLVTYSSEDTSVVQVDDGGRLTATSPGITEVSATAGSKKGKTTVRVTGKPGSTTTQVRVSPATGTAESGQQLQFTAEVVDGSGTVLLDRSVFWWSADTRIATVDEAGLVTGVGAGTALINATSDGVTGSAELTVEAAPLTATATPGRVTDLTGVGATTSEVSVRFTEVSDGTGQAANYQVRFGPAPSTNWGAMTPVATGTCAGAVAGTSVGQSLTCTVAGLSAGTSYDIQLVAYRGSMVDGTAVFGELSNSARHATQASAGTASVTISPQDVTLRSIDETHQFTVMVRDDSGNLVTNPGVIWASSNTGVATVNSTGLVRARGAGIALITAVAACCGTDTAAVRVELPSEPPPPAEGINTLATINWTNGTGTSTAAWTDGDTRRNVLCDASTVNPTVRTAANEGWSGPGNVLRMQNTTAGCGGLLLRGLMPEPAEGDFWVLRWSYKQSSDQVYDQVHTVVGFSPTAPGAGKMVLNRTGRLASGNWYHVLGLSPSNFGWEMRVMGSPSTRLALAPDTWYRFEVAYEWFGLDGGGNRRYRVYPRAYNPAGQLIADEGNYVSDYVNGVQVNQSLASYYAGGGFLLYPAASLGSPNVGENPRDFWMGISRSYATDAGHLYWAGVSVGTAEQRVYFGPYSP